MNEIDTFLAKYDPPIAKLARAVRKRLGARYPWAFELVYDNYNALVFAFGTTERPSDFLFSIALYPKWVTLFFGHGVSLKDPKKLLVGSGVRVRSVRLAEAADVDRDDIVALLDQEVALADVEPAAAKGRTIVRSISKKQRPRRPA